MKWRGRINITAQWKRVTTDLLNIIHLFFTATLLLNWTLVSLVVLNNFEIGDICHLHLKCQCKQEDDITRTPLGFCYKVTSCHFIQILFLCKGIGMWVINCRLRTRIICSLFRKKQKKKKRKVKTFCIIAAFRHIWCNYRKLQSSEVKYKETSACNTTDALTDLEL